VAEIAAKEHRVSEEFGGLRDYRSFAAAAAELRRQTIRELRTDTRRTVTNRLEARDGGCGPYSGVVAAAKTPVSGRGPSGSPRRAAWTARPTSASKGMVEAVNCR